MSSESNSADLRARLADAEETIRAIYAGEVDAVVVNSAAGPRVYKLEGADHPYRVMVEQMHEATITLDRDQVVLYSNPQFSVMVGLPSEAIAGNPFDRFLAPLTTGLFQGLADLAAKQGYGSGEINLITATGEHVPVRLSLTPLDIAGVDAICIVASDLREQRRNESLIREEQLSRLILDQAGEGIVVIDPEGTILRCSASARSLAGRPALLGHFDTVFPITVDGATLDSNRILAGARASETIRGLETLMQCPDASFLSLLVSTSPLLSPSRDLLGCVVTLTDISGRKRAEHALARQAEELASSNADLRQFAYSASHDLREPLRQIAVFSEMLQQKHETDLSTDAIGLINQTVHAAHRMEGLIRDLLAYTQATDAPQEISPHTDANEVVRKTLAVFESQIAQSGGRVEVEPLPNLEVHEVHLTQLFQNLVGNSLKYRSEAPPVIHISAEPSGRFWKITVADNGIGIDPQYQNQIFGLFQRLHGGGKYSGNGIGLAICHKIVQRYRGRIHVESAPGLGSRFVFTLPAGVNDAA